MPTWESEGRAGLAPDRVPGTEGATRASTGEERRRRRAVRRRLEIVEAAKAVFIRSSYGSVTLEEIAEAADVSKATLYLYFESKAAIYEAVLLRDMRSLVDALSAAASEQPAAADALRSLARAYLAYFKANAEYFAKLSFYFYPGREQELPERVADQVEILLREAVQVVADCVAAGVARGELSSADPWASALALWALWEGSMWSERTGRTRRYGRSVEQIVETGMAPLLLAARAVGPGPQQAPDVAAESLVQPSRPRGSRAKGDGEHGPKRRA